MPDFGVFIADDQAGELWTITADSAEDAQAQTLATHPGATVSVVPAEELEGCSRSLLLWEWLGALRQRSHG